MKIINEYVKVLDLCFSNPPRTVSKRCKEIMEKYPIDVVSIDGKGFCMVVKISDGFYGISWVVVHPEYQNNKIGSRLLEKVHNKYNGVFITKTRDADGFYKKLGYTEIYRDNEHIILTFVNDKNKVIF